MMEPTTQRRGRHAALLEQLARFVSDEREAVNHRLMTLWQRPIADKLRQGQSQRFVRLERRDDATTFWAYPDEGESRFREGDLLHLHGGSPFEHTLARKVRFEAEEEDRWLLRCDKALSLFSSYQDGPCYADEDAVDLSAMFDGALADIATSAAGREVILPLLERELEIEFDVRDCDDGERIASAAGLNARQAEAVGKAYGALHIACIQGPPGTGKTRVLALIVRLMVERGERVLVTSHTHTAINNALNKIHAEGVPLVKISGESAPRELLRAIPRHDSLDAWRERPQHGGYVVGATPFATCSKRLEHAQFDVVVFDEASQITVALALMAMRKGRRFIFIGDQKQLPPVVLSASVLSKQTLSVFARLTAEQSEHHVMLDQTYRMNRWLADWPSRQYYGGALRAEGANAERAFALAAQAPSRLDAVLDAAPGPLFIATGDPRARTRNVRDATLVVDLCEALHARGLALAEIGIVTPFRAQGRTLRGLLGARFGATPARAIVADTVERMQGQERECVIVSLASGDMQFLQAIAEFFFQPERLNVALTRAKTRLIIIGPQPDAQFGVGDKQIDAWIASYRDLLAHCQHISV